MNIYVIRHAQTTMNAKGKVFSGRTDVSLSENGIIATKEIAKNLLWKNIECVFITPLKRTKQTADIIFPQSINRVTVRDLAEMDFGDYEGSIMTEDNKDDPVFYDWVNNPEKVKFPNGEELLEHANRAFKALIGISELKQYENVAIVSHATTIRLIISQILTGRITYFRSIPCDNGCVSLIQIKDGAVKLKYINAPL